MLDFAEKHQIPIAKDKRGDAPFSIDNEQLTPSMKIRRHVIRKAYGERLDALYKR